ncbi:MAG: tetratricopeptide repeat protein [Candidatus Binataceae bacterium]
MRRFLARFGEGDARTGAWLAAIIIGAALIYLRSLGNEFVFDDLAQIVHNPHLSEWSFAPRSFVNDVVWFRDPFHLPQSPYYRPLHDLWLWVNFQLFGFHPTGWHAATIALHLLTLWLVFRVAVKLSGDRSAGLLTTALFATMPIHAAVVAYPAAVAAALCAMFELAAFDCYLRWRSSLSAGGPRHRSLALSLGFFAGGLLSYEAAVVFPILVSVHAYIFGHERDSGKDATTAIARRAGAAVAAAWPYALEAAAYLALREWVLGFAVEPNFRILMTPAQVALTIPAALAMYATLLVAPWQAGPAHHLGIVRSAASPEFYLSVVGLTSLCAAGYFALRRNSRYRIYLFSAAWILISLAPALDVGRLVIGVLIQDRYVYLASFGFCLMASDLIVSLAQFYRSKAAVVWLGVAAALIGSAVLLAAQLRYWKDGVVLAKRCIEESPDAEMWHNQLGIALRSRGDLLGARRELERAAAIAPDDGFNLYQLGRLYARLGEPRRGERVMAVGLKQFPYPPPGGDAELALVADAAGDAKGSAAAIAQAEKVPGGADAADLARARIEFRRGDAHGAEKTLRGLLARSPNNAEALAILGAVLSAEHRYVEALAAVRRAAAIDPQQPLLHYLIALALHQMGHDPEARAECAIALAGAPNDPGARGLMAILRRVPARPDSAR